MAAKTDIRMRLRPQVAALRRPAAPDGADLTPLALLSEGRNG